MEKVTMKSSELNKIIDIMISAIIDAKMPYGQQIQILRVFYPILGNIIERLRQMHMQRIEQKSDQMQSFDTLLSIVLQFTSKYNYDIMQHYVTLLEKYQYSPFNGILEIAESNTIKLRITLENTYRMFEAQPYFIKVWNVASLFNESLSLQLSKSEVHESSKVEFMIAVLRHMISPDSQTQRALEQLKSEEMLNYISSLTLNKEEEVLKQVHFNNLFGKLAIIESADQEIEQHESKIMTDYLKQRVDKVLDSMNEDIFKHFVIIGEEGSGKMSFIELLSHHFHSYQRQSSEKTKHQNPYIVVTLEETFDSKNLVGTYVCNESGEFVFKKGPLTVAAEQGLWLVLRNIEKIPSDLLTFLLPLVQSNELQVSSEFKIVPQLGFRIFALCQSRGSSSQGMSHHEDIKPFLSHLVEVTLDKIQGRQDFDDILRKAFSKLYQLNTLPSVLFQSIDYLNLRLNNQLKHQLLDHKQFSIRQVFKLFNRIEKFIASNFRDHEIARADQEESSFFLASDSKRQIIEEITDIYLGYVYDKQIKAKLVEELVQNVWNNQEADKSQLDPQSISDYVINHSREYQVSQKQCYFGRTSAIQVSQQEDEEMEDELQNKSQSKSSQRQFVYTAATLRTLEQILAAINHNEATLLVGETGTGKTTQVQQIAKILGKKIHVFNMNQNTDSADLLGGFKPVDLKFLLKPIYERFLYVFKSLFKSDKNQKFLDLIQKCYEENRVKDFLQCLNHGLSSIASSKQKATHSQDIEYLNLQVKEVTKRQAKLESGGGFIFQFIEGTLIQSIKNGEWILLDEINLASEQVLNRVATLVEGDYILLNERADIVETKRHSDFRIFMCMNPPYTSAGKKQLPWSLRSKLTEIYVPELDNQNDLWNIINQNCSTQVQEGQKRKILEFYMRVREQVFKQTKRGNIGLRNLTRALAFMKSSIQLRYPLLKAIYDSLYTCFASHLEPILQSYIQSLILGLFQIKSLPELSIQAEEKISDKYAYIEQFVIPKGQFKPENFDEKDFVTTNTFKKLLKQLASVVAVTDYAVILQGPTSAGKTSTVQYLANITHNKVIRINNHMHTDIQEYLGSYVPDKEGGGKLVFQEGVLVEAVRQGYWVILDELNLAPSEVLEALNRLLDDNRELFIVETQKVVKAHPNFRIFATQNPTEGYGGRKELSEAFKNRFILINVNEVPKDELELILVHKCSMPQTRAKLMVEVMESLQIYRSQGSVFSGKDSTITVRDLLKWANRLLKLQSVSTQDLALEGFLVLGERSRNEQDKQFIKQTIERVIKTKIEERRFYEEYFRKHLKSSFDNTPVELNLPKLIQSQQLKRLAVLMHKCLMNHEPVLLVGETGVGKTTLCQIFAALNKQTLYSINCHQNTETSDFIGCMRTRKNLKQIQDQFQQEMQKLQSLLNPLNVDLKNSYKELMKFKKSQDIKTLSVEIQGLLKSLKSLKEDLECIFEWHDGILVESMQTGGLLLIDEISLANDSVLERLNSVFEADRTLVLSEKSSKEAIKIKGADGFNMVATMNPSGDFGKKELSPALRNRMTEIWVESYFLQQELVELYKSTESKKFTSELSFPLFIDVKDNIDLYLIIKETALDKLKEIIKDAKMIESLAVSVFNFIGFINFTLASRHFSLQRKALSIRDILNILDFIKVTLSKQVFSQYQNQVIQSKSKNKKGKQSNQQVQSSEDIEPCVVAFRNAIELVIVDGLCLGIDVAGEKQKREILQACEAYLQQIQSTIFQASSLTRQLNYVDNKEFIGVGPFLINKTKESVQGRGSYAFDADTTKVNLLKLLRAYQLSKPILIEGPPGVGKTSLIENLAKVSGRKLVRVNLSEQTDMMDLLGSEYPVSSSSHKSKDTKKEEEKMTDVNEEGKHQDKGIEDDDDEIRFHWCDGVLLQALKEGSWFLIDEMNLAQQSVLEGLNALLDHRRTVYIPELNQEFVCHPDFFVFACQNPSQSTSSVGGRKTLPKSFLNRFNKIYLEELSKMDYEVIIKRQLELKGTQNDINVEQLLNLSHQIELLIKQDSNMYQDEGAVNMRDLSRFMHLYRKFRYQEGNNHDSSLFHAFQICYLQRLSSKKHNQAIKLLSQSGLIENQDSLIQQSAVQVRVTNDHGILFQSQVKETQMVHSSDLVSLILANTESDLINLKGPHSLSLQYMIDCLNTDIPLLVQTNNPQRFIQNLQTLSIVAGYKLNRLLLNEKSDTSQLLGCFEQTSQNNLNRFLEQNIYSQFSSELKSEIIDLKYRMGTIKKQKGQVQLLQNFINSHPQVQSPELQHKFNLLIKQLKKAASRFEWVDSILLKAIEQGEWVVFENANLCNPSILDRLNPLLEEGNQFLTINEQGLVEGDEIRMVKAHPSFRSIFVVSHHTSVDQGKDVSRALKNRCLQLKVYYSQEQQIDMIHNQKSFDNQDTQIKADLAPYIKYKQVKDLQSEGYRDQLIEGLGKRKDRQDSNRVSQQVLEYSVEQLNSYFSQEELSEQDKTFYKSYLSYLAATFKSSYPQTRIRLLGKYSDDKYALSLSEDQDIADGWALFVKSQISIKKTAIANFFKFNKVQFLSKSAQQFVLQSLSLNVETSTDSVTQLTYLILLKQLLKALRLKDLGLVNYSNFYLLSQSKVSKNEVLLSNLTQMIQHSDDSHIFELIAKFSSSDVHLQSQLLKLKSYGSNLIKPAIQKQLKQVKEQLYEINQMPLKVCVVNLANKSQQLNRIHIKSLMQNFSVLIMDDDKQFLKFDSLGERYDLYMIQEKVSSPYMILIPNDQSKILLSQSGSLYDSLNFIKDLSKAKKLSQLNNRQLGGVNTSFSRLSEVLRRHTKLPVLSGSFSSGSVESHLIQQLAIASLENWHYSENRSHSQVIESILESEDRVNLRDLPAHFLCNTTLQRSISKLLRHHYQQIEKEESLRLRDILLGDSRVSNQVKQALTQSDDEAQAVLFAKKQALRIEGHDHANFALDEILDGITVLESLDVNDLLETLFIIPLELFRLEKLRTFEESHHYSHYQFLLHHIRCEVEAARQTDSVLASINQLNLSIEQLSKVKPDSEASQLLKSIIFFTRDISVAMSLNSKQGIHGIFDLLQDPANFDQIHRQMKISINMLVKAFENFFVQYNHLISVYLLALLTIQKNTLAYLTAKTEKVQVLTLQSTLLNFSQNANPVTSNYVLHYNYKIQQLRSYLKTHNSALTNSSHSSLLYEQSLKYLLKLKRILSQGGDKSDILKSAIRAGKSKQTAASSNQGIGVSVIEKDLSAFILEHFVRREIAKKMRQEQQMDDAEALIYQLPFKMKVQNIMENNKAMDERTKEDKEKMEKEAQLEIEANFPSYFDEFQKSLYTGQADIKRDPITNRKKKQEIKASSILTEILCLDDSQSAQYKKSFVKLRLKILQSFYKDAQMSQFQHLLEYQDLAYLQDAGNYLREDLSAHQLPSIMNVSDVTLSQSYNFYHDPLSTETRLVYQPLSQLISKIRDILQQWESPILNDAMFLANLIITECRPKHTPVMKVLTGLELIINKLDEWEVYASKSVGNSLEAEIMLMKQLIIRYRKIQILSWSNLLTWKKNKMIQEDFENFIRLAHTLERQVFDKQLYKQTKPTSKLETEKNSYEIELKIFELLDLFIRDSSLGQFQARMKFLSILLDHFKAKLKAEKYPLLRAQYKSITPQMKQRLHHLINILDFVVIYYSQFHAKLSSTIARLDAEARDKVKTLMDVKKWTVQKFDQVKNNIDKTHRQLNKAVNHEEEILMQNIASLILTSSRKKYVKDESQLMSVTLEKGNTSYESLNAITFKVPRQYQFQNEIQIVKQLNFFERKYIEAKYPDSLNLEYTMLDMFDRIKNVRELNKKHIQRRAFVDLLKFMKDQGLQHNFQQGSAMSKLLIEQPILHTSMQDFSGRTFENVQEYSKYLLKSYELMMLLESSSQVDEHADLRNVDIIRIRGFSQSLLLKILQFNQSLSQIESQYTSISKIQEQIKDYYENTTAQECLEGRNFATDRKLNHNYKNLVEKFKISSRNLSDKLKMIQTLDLSSSNGSISLHLELQQINKAYFTTQSHEKLERSINQVLEKLNDINKALENEDKVETLRKRKFIAQQLLIFENLKLQSKELIVDTLSSNSEKQGAKNLSKKVSLFQRQVQLLYQDLLKNLEETNQIAQDQLIDGQRRDSNMTDTTISMDDRDAKSKTAEHTEAQEQKESEKVELSIKERHDFLLRSEKILQQYLPNIQEMTQKIFSFKLQGDCNNDKEQLKHCSILIAKMRGLMEYIRENETTYLKSLAKFSFITQRVFIYLIYEGFCGQDDKQDDNNQQEQDDDDKYFEQDGCGMGDGQGGEQNVSNQIEHEEQLEGLKNYDSDEEQKQENKEEKDKNNQEEEEQNNDFEMQNDFEGDLEDAPDQQEEEENKDDKESDEDDAMDEVDDLLDNQLWNQNMEDLEQEEDDQDQDSKDDKEELDLGERNLDKENQLKNQEKELKAGDRDKQEREEGPGEEDKNNPEHQEDEEMVDDDQQAEDDQQMPDGEEEKEEVPLDRDENVVDDNQQPEEQPHEEGMEDVDNQSEQQEAPENGEEDKAREDDENMEGFEDQHNDQEINEQEHEQDQNNQDDEGQEEYKKDFNKQVLDNDQIQSNEQENQKQQEQDQSNLKRQQKSSQTQNQQQNKNKDNQQSQAQELDQQTQFDVNGSDILHQLAQRFHQQHQQKQQQNQQDRKQEQQDKSKQQVDQPRMAQPSQQEDQQQQQQQDNQEQDQNEGQAMEYEFDEQAEQMQGKLATDKIEDSQLKTQQENEDEKMQMEEDNNHNQQQQDMHEEDIQQTEQQILNKSIKQAVEKDSDIIDEEAKTRPNDQITTVNDEINEQDLIENYQEYLNHKQLTSEAVQDEERNSSQLVQDTSFSYDIDKFDYSLQKQIMRELFGAWMQDSELHRQSLELLNQFKQQTVNSSSSLCEQLRIVLEPQLSQSLQGDYKTGKRLNMKKVISFIASHYRNDKIWLRRTMPSKRDYKILIAIDDSLSMKENNLGFFSLESLVTITEALNRLEVGKVAVAGIRERLDLFQSFEDGYSNERTAFILSQFNFNYSAPKSADYAMANFVRDTNQMLDAQNSGTGDAMNCPFVIVLSDGRFNKNNVRPYLAEAREKKYLYIFVILDSLNPQKEATATTKPANKKQGSGDGSILSMKSVEKNEETGAIKLVPYLRDFPFEYYCIVRDIHQLPQALGSILVQWFSLMSGASGSSSK